MDPTRGFITDTDSGSGYPGAGGIQELGPPNWGSLIF
jgi:hypothetical protein